MSRKAAMWTQLYSRCAYREAWCRIRRSPDHSLAGAFLFPERDIRARSIARRITPPTCDFLHSAKASGHARNIFTPLPRRLCWRGETRYDGGPGK